MAQSYDGRFLTYGTVIDGGGGPTLCTPVIAASLPPRCDGAPIEGWTWGAVEHDEQAGSRWGEYVLIGRWDGATFALTQPARQVDWSQVKTRVSEDDTNGVPCSEPAGGWWSDTTDPERLGPEDYNAAIDVVNTRAELLSIEVVTPDQPRPPEIRVEPTDVGWVPGVLVVELSASRDGDEEAIRARWGGPVCLAVVGGLSRGELTEMEADVIDLEEDIAPDAGILGIGVHEGQVQVDVWVAIDDAQGLLDEQFGPGVVRLVGRLWAID